MRNTFTLFCAFLGILCSCYPQNKETDLAAFIKEKGDSILKAQKLPGLFVGVLDNGRCSYYNFGYADPSIKMPFDSATYFEAGSITKTFTAYLLLSVLKENGIDENTPIVKYLPDSVKSNSGLQHITFLKLLNHTSGLPRLPDNINLNTKQPYFDYDADDLFSYLKTARPRTDGKSEYSNLGFGLAGALTTIITRSAYNVLLAQYILMPFNMMPSLDELRDYNNQKKSKGFFGDQPADYWIWDALGGAGNVVCTASQMLTYLDRIANPVQKGEKDIVAKLLEPTDSLNRYTKIGRAWIISGKEDRPAVYWHNGGTYGFSTFAGFFKGQQKAVVIVVNKFNSNEASDNLGMMIMNKLRD